MSEQPKADSKPTLGDDGELHQLLDDPASRRDAIFCVHCSAANLPGAKFCNECGRSLVEQQANISALQGDDLAKRKHRQAQRPELGTYDPSLYELRRKRGGPANLIVTAVALGAGVALYIGVAIMSAIARNPAEYLVIGIIGLVAIPLWIFERSRMKSRSHEQVIQQKDKNHAGR